MKLESVTVSKRGYIVLPAHIRKEMNIESGTRILINKEKGRLTLEAVPSFTQKLAGLTRNTIGNTPEKVESFIDNERKDRTDD
ncbi:MAG: AbrB/MazE/SpoVT family DNA-binding domain-containing protein [Verrucomicrobia bacterium]|nr:AbrB/MazE/SpoVT family DNA-binding domain-containing protein [Verrucomicrobiota bacterium]MCF7707416.1 AbrB/MazE/SpoVT family DNA-binding domain-containing protein [Verrucomicrobiota bacterium]